MEFTGERFLPECSRPGDPIESEHLQRYLAVTELVRGRVVLDAASGEGFGSHLMAEVAEAVAGIDISDEAVAHAQRKYPRANLAFQQASVAALPFADRHFDRVVSFETIEHVDEATQRAFLAEIRRVLKDDGLLIMSTPDRRVYSDLPNYSNPFHVREFYHDEFVDFLRGAFAHVAIFYQRHQSGVVLTGAGATSLHLLDPYRAPANEGIYLVAVCAHQPLPAEVSSLNTIMLDHTRRVEAEVEALHARLLALGTHLADKEAQIVAQEVRLAELHQLIGLRAGFRQLARRWMRR